MYLDFIVNYAISQTELEDMLSETHVSEEKAKKAMIDAARLADELRMEQENAQVRTVSRNQLTRH